MATSAEQKWRSIAIAVAVLAIGGCYTVPKQTGYVASVEPPPAWTPTEVRARVGARYMAVSTDRPRYEFYDEERRVTVTIRILDTAPGSVVLRGCPHAPARYIEQWDGTEWRDRGMIGVLCAAIYSSETVILERGDSLKTEVLIREPGRYRVRIPAGYSSPPDFVGLSNEFLVRDRDGHI